MWESECVFIGKSCTPKNCGCMDVQCRLKESEIDNIMKEEIGDMEDIQLSMHVRMSSSSQIDVSFISMKIKKTIHRQRLILMRIILIVYPDGEDNIHIMLNLNIQSVNMFIHISIIYQLMII